MFYEALERRQSAKRGREWRHHCRICARTIAAGRRQPRQDYTDAVKLERGCDDCHRIRTRSREHGAFGKDRT